MEKMDKLSILRMAMGAIEERVDYDMGKVIDNILDPNTDAKKKRQITITLDLVPDAERRTVHVTAGSKTKLVPTDPVVTSLYVSSDLATGEMTVYEMVPQIPGQLAVDGAEQNDPKILKFAKRA